MRNIDSACRGLWGETQYALLPRHQARDGWLYYRKTKHRPGGALANAFLDLQSMVDPEKRHVLEVRRQEKQEESDAGAPPAHAAA